MADPNSQYTSKKAETLPSYFFSSEFNKEYILITKIDMKQNSDGNRAQFATRLGVIATTVGSAVGLGNIWRFPYEAGTHGGGAFMLVYLFFILVIGIPVITAEFLIGSHTRSNVYGAFQKLHRFKLWQGVGVIGIMASLLIISFYSVVAGWTLRYFFWSFTGFEHSESATTLHQQFVDFTTSIESVWWAVGFMIVNTLILRRGVQQGIEKMSNLMMPMLFLILTIFCVRSLFMPCASEGLAFIFKPDFSCITPDVMMGAMGQAFFSLSLGLGTLITYSSYFNPKTPLLGSAATTAGLDTVVAIMAGVIIFPAVFTFGESPAAGPRLVFEVLPAIFGSMPWPAFWSALFFLLLFIASLTSTISMSEISIAYFSEEKGMSRQKATFLSSAFSFAGCILCALSFGPLADFTVCGKGFFDMFDYLSSNILLPLGGMLISVFVGWFVPRKVIDQVLGHSTPARRFVVTCVVFCLRFVAPLCILAVFINGLR